MHQNEHFKGLLLKKLYEMKATSREFYGLMDET